VTILGFGIASIFAAENENEEADAGVHWLRMGDIAGSCEGVDEK
jgi:hypothetical protein